MGTGLTIEYDAIGDTLYLDIVAPHEGGHSSEVAEGVIVRSNAETGEIEGVEIQGLKARAASEQGLTIPVSARFASAVVPASGR